MIALSTTLTILGLSSAPADAVSESKLPERKTLGETSASCPDKVVRCLLCGDGLSLLQQHSSCRLGGGQRDLRGVLQRHPGRHTVRNAAGLPQDGTWHNRQRWGRRAQLVDGWHWYWKRRTVVLGHHAHGSRRLYLVLKHARWWHSWELYNVGTRLGVWGKRLQLWPKILSHLSDEVILSVVLSNNTAKILPTNLKWYLLLPIGDIHDVVITTLTYRLITCCSPPQAKVGLVVAVHKNPLGPQAPKTQCSCMEKSAREVFSTWILVLGHVNKKFISWKCSVPESWCWEGVHISSQEKSIISEEVCSRAYQTLLAVHVSAN